MVEVPVSRKCRLGSSELQFVVSFYLSPVFPVPAAEGEAEVRRAVAEGVLRGTRSSSTTVSPHAVVQSSRRSLSTAVAPKTKSARSTLLVDSGQGFAMDERSYCGTRCSTPGIPPHGQKEVLATPRSSWTPSTFFAISCSKSMAPRGCSGTSSLRVVASAI